MDMFAYSYIVGGEVARLPEFRPARRFATDYSLLICLVTNVFVPGH